MFTENYFISSEDGFGKNKVGKFGIENRKCRDKDSLYSDSRKKPQSDNRRECHLLLNRESSIERRRIYVPLMVLKILIQIQREEHVKRKKKRDVNGELKSKHK